MVGTRVLAIRPVLFIPRACTNCICGFNEAINEVEAGIERDTAACVDDHHGAVTGYG